MFYSAGIFSTSSLGGSISSNCERTALRRWGEEPGHIGVLQQRAGGLNIKRLLLIQENRICQLKEFRAFLYIRRCKSLGSLKSFLWYASQLSGTSILCFHILSFLRAHQLTIGCGCKGGGCNGWWLWHPLFTDMSGHILLLRYIFLSFFCILSLYLQHSSFHFFYLPYCIAQDLQCNVDRNGNTGHFCLISKGKLLIFHH